MQSLKLAFLVLVGLLVLGAIINALDPGLIDWLNSPAVDEAGRSAGRAFGRWTIDNCLWILAVGLLGTVGLILWGRSRQAR